jgi:hypothetical protein
MDLNFLTCIFFETIKHQYKNILKVIIHKNKLDDFLMNLEKIDNIFCKDIFRE